MQGQMQRRSHLNVGLDSSQWPEDQVNSASKRALGTRCSDARSGLDGMCVQRVGQLGGKCTGEAVYLYDIIYMHFYLCQRQS